MTNGQLWVEPVGDLIIARIRGVDTPPVDIPLAQRKLDEALGGVHSLR